jgi:hypothetical protein
MHDALSHLFHVVGLSEALLAIAEGSGKQEVIPQNERWFYRFANAGRGSLAKSGFRRLNICR